MDSDAVLCTVETCPSDQRQILWNCNLHFLRASCRKTGKRRDWDAH